MNLIDQIKLHAAHNPDQVAISWPEGDCVYAGLLSLVNSAIQLLEEAEIEILALDIDNGPAWVALDIAALQLGICLIPLPPFFSAGQLQHILRQSGAEAVVTDNPVRLLQRTGSLLLDGQIKFNLEEHQLFWMKTAPDPVHQKASVPAGVHKITYTSGTTGEPKGVMLSWTQMLAVAESLANAVGLNGDDRHLVLMPLAVLLENIGGVYASLWGGASLVLLPLAQTGLSGSSGIDGKRMIQALQQSGATTAIFTPQTLQSVLEVLERNSDLSLMLRFAAVGGAPVSSRLLQRASAIGLPVYEGYGLSECASVVTLNTPAGCRPGSVGRPLPHIHLDISENGEVLIKGTPFVGYLGDPKPADLLWPTGDLGVLDNDGFLYLRGRSRNLFITAFGRNIAPEWIERELTLEPEIAQAAVFGEARPYNVAVVVPKIGFSSSDIEAALVRANRSLPDYARVSGWIPADAPFSTGNNLLTGTGRIRRKLIAEQYGAKIDLLYRRNQTI